jgi:hypothetical protein
VTTVRARLLVTLASLTALAATGCYDPNKVSAPDEVLLLTASPDAIPANGFSTSRITARVTTSTTRNLTIAFTSSGGTLSPTTTHAPDGAGEASVFLTSESVPKTVTVTADVKEGADVLVSRSVTVTFGPATADSVLRLITSSNQIEADGVSSVFLQAELNPAGASRTVSFKTTDGSFAREGATPKREEPNVTAGADGIARVQLFAPVTPGSALVTATTIGANGAAGFSATQTITFSPAVPDFMSVSADPLAVSRAVETNKITVTAKLSRPIGKVSTNTLVDFSIVNDASGQPFGRFQNITRSDDSETATAEFVPGTTGTLGLATITARVRNTNVTAQIKVDITP